MAPPEHPTPMRDRLSAAGSLIGIPVHVSDGTEWEFEGGLLRVGLGWFRERGHSDDEAEVLALLELWQLAENSGAALARSRRARTLTASSPDAEPLIALVERLQSASELLATFPGLRQPLFAAVSRHIPVSIEEQPRHLQWVLYVLARWTGRTIDASDNRATQIGVAVRTEAEGLDRGLASDPIRRVLAADPRREPLARFERALALLLPPYLRLLKLDRQGRGPVGGSGQVGSDALSLDLGAKNASSAASAENDAEAADRAERQSGNEGEEGEQARSGEGREFAEGADLFEAEQAALMTAILSTPLPATGALRKAIQSEIDTKEREAHAVATSQGGLSDSGAVESRASLSAYRLRVAVHADAIEAMRELWQRVIADRIAPRMSPGRQAMPEGDTLATESLAGAIAQAIAGIPKPHAFRVREPRKRRVRRAGSTDYVLLIDRSASMSGYAARAAADAILIMLEGLAGAERDVMHAEQAAGIPLELDIRTALITFANDANIVKPLSGGLDDDVRAAVHGAVSEPGGTTDDVGALAAAAAQLGVPGVPGIGGAGVGDPVPVTRETPDGVERRRVVILISDGGSNDEQAANSVLQQLRAAGVRVHGIGINSDEIVRRYAPHSVRVDHPRDIVTALHGLIRDELP